ncbi:MULTISPECIES: TRAP transporter substrate-binding protein [Roseobacteraceae]|uniref:TRAP transporter substrate-binding protein n=1 Tax=Roseobacteraceae TaxID=2854170 RepID=UPI00080ABB38|nr:MULTISPECIES: TRAP transporter substrate-binding protein [Roseobacteraceae]ANT60827.1 C4-dicarboxylate ABC transporter substrate-binding protein [Salipiger sp. CCB-MM3]MCA0995755.1 TRAP transporter substrate-binding protein [Alloyangia pacifica]NDV98723.1 TRAP transporter substrate-binding protein [Salipiger sp. PrR002]NDW57560.1 TRAP transporter substrate-binding protein [Salipiger sp. PrR004]
MKVKTLLKAATAAAVLAGPALAQDVTLRIQTHYNPEQTSGKLAAQFVDDVEVMSGGAIDIEMFYASSVVATVETFDAAANGILDCDMTGGAYQTGKNAGFQFVGDIMGGYDTPYQQLSWLYYGGGLEQAQKLYNEFGMQLIGWWVYGQESLVSSTPITGPDDLKDWKFRSPPGMETEIFANLGASPIVMDFTEVFTAMETGIIEGTDYSGLANDESIGLFDLAKHATYPGFHSMPSDHLACNKMVWDGLSDQNKRIIETAMEKLALRSALYFEKANNEAAARLTEAGVTLHDWTAEDRATFREAAQSAWDVWAEKSPEAKALVESHKDYLGQLGLISAE